MSKLRNRIASVGSANYEAMGNYHPAGTADTPMVMPIHRVIMTADGATVERLTPMVTNQGVIPASAPGQWGQVHAAGRP